MNKNARCELPPLTISIVPANNWLVRWKEQQLRFPYFPGAEQAIANLNDLNRHGEGVPAIVYRSRSDSEELRVYASDYYLGLYPNQRGDGYILSHMEPIDPRAHDMLADGVLLLQKASYQLCYRLPDIPHGSANCQSQIWQAWAILEQEKQQRRLGGQTQELVTVAQKKYLNTVSSLIDITYQLEQEKYKLSASIPYLKFTSTDGQRSGLHDIYEFHLQRPVQIWQERYLLRITDTPDLRGSILSLTGMRLKVKFETAIDRKRIPRQGSFEILPNSYIFDVQRQAVKMFQEGTARNQHLLSVLVNHHYQPHQPATYVHPELNAEQRIAFQHALTVPDLLLVLGPPGTGKTHTITEIVHHSCAINKEHILVVSRTHKAVDNVLSHLPPSLEAIRLGHEDRVSAETRHLLLNAKTEKMQEDILRRTERRSIEFACFLGDAREITSWRRELRQCSMQMERLEQQKQNTQDRKQIVSQNIISSFDQESRTLKTQLQVCIQQLEMLGKKQERWRISWVKQTSRTQLFALGWFFAWRSEHSRHQFIQTQSLYEEVQTQYTALTQENRALRAQIQRALWANAEYRMLKDAEQQLEQSLSEASHQASKVIGLLHATVGGSLQVSAPPKNIHAAVVRQYADWYEQQYPLLTRQATLMSDWRAQLKESGSQLRPEVIRYADVIGATCIGAATTRGLEDMNFDLAVVDEAGQICLADLLVPLARASRAVLVGDHQQLPPFVDNEVRTWLESLTLQEDEAEYSMDNQTIRRHLTYSAFELLFAGAARNQRLVRLKHQFRMPEAIAKFASKHFYEDQLHTAHPEKVLGARHHDPLFRFPLAVINTTALAKAGQREERKLKAEHWGEEGYINQVEARVISALAAYYEQINAQWVVIVPYRAQAQCIIEFLQNQFQTTAIDWEDRISTVDAFQGSERKKVIYGFTRSNPHGRVGFLTELRRLNVALTRAQEQLIVVGDFSTLVNAMDEHFRDLARSLYQHTQQYGEILSYEQCMQRLAAAKQKE